MPLFLEKADADLHASLEAEVMHGVSAESSQILISSKEALGMHTLKGGMSTLVIFLLNT